MSSTPQQFGGTWSLLKVAAVANYLRAFNQALSKRSFSRIYIDAFAGSGEFTYEKSDNGISLFDNESETKVHAGSAKHALSTQPEFHRLIFIENNPKNVLALEQLAKSDSKNRAIVVQGDANTEVEKICKTTNWDNTRGVIFLDPYGNSVEWRTLEAVSRTCLDVWYLFPLAGVFRNAPIDKAQLTLDKRDSITKILGTSEWEQAFYRERPPQIALFGPPETPADERHFDVNEIEEFVKKRLETIFPLVLAPGRLRTSRNAPMYSLFFAMSNSSKKAQDVARPIAAHILSSL